MLIMKTEQPDLTSMLEHVCYLQGVFYKCLGPFDQNTNSKMKYLKNVFPLQTDTPSKQILQL